jgi:phosphoesterase RecJ-like protein
MTSITEAAAVNDIIRSNQKFVVVQADNPDGDSLASSLALEHILGDMGKEVVLYCGVDMPGYLKYLPGSDRVVTELPSDFDASIIVDTSSDTLLEQLGKTGQKNWLASKPTIVLDHHNTPATISFATVICNFPAVSTSEVIYELASQLDWPMNLESKELIAIAILSDSLGLTSESVTARSVHIIGELVESGVNLAKIDSARRETMKREAELIPYKGQLLQRVEFHNNGTVATVTIPWEEIERYSPLYNPSMLVLDDMRLAKNVRVAIAFKVYKDGRVTAKIRCNWGSGIADKIAEHFGGGGHPYASGFKILKGKTYQEIKTEAVEVAATQLEAAGVSDAKAL